MTPDPQTQDFLTRRTLETAQDALLEKIIEETPVLAAEARTIAQVLRESVQWEREKRGAERGGTLHLYPYKRKKDSSQPDLIGKGCVAGRSYKAAAWINDDHALRVALIRERANG